jgi:hypothetical protein
MILLPHFQQLEQHLTLFHSFYKAVKARSQQQQKKQKK